MEEQVQVDKKAKKSKKFAAESQMTAEDQATGTDAAANEATEAIAKAKGAPRPRKVDYGIADDAQIVRLVDTANVRKDILLAWQNTDDNPTVAEFFTRYSEAERVEARHGLRVMSRRKLIKIVHPDGSEFPRDIVPGADPEPSEAGATPEGTDQE